tara:strand:- start:5830 stop:6078 length:249 start_codon:yes stop_codon:yes gene_type:complete
MKKFNKDYFLSNDNDVVVYGRHTIEVGFDSNLSTKVINILYNMGKPYIIDENKEAPKTKKVILDEPKESKQKTNKYSKKTKS